MERTTVIILRKTLFRESDIMATAVSPDWGRMELVCYGAQSVSGGVDKGLDIQGDFFEVFERINGKGQRF